MSSPQLRLPMHPSGVRLPKPEPDYRRSAPFETEPGFYDLGRLWLYGNSRLLGGDLDCVLGCFGNSQSSAELNRIEQEAERIVLAGRVLVCGVHNPAHQRAAVVPLRWGSPRIVVFSGGFRAHLGQELKDEPFRVGRLWRYQWDPVTDLAVSRRAPDKMPTFAHDNPTVDRLIELITLGQWPGQSLFFDPPSLESVRS